MLRRLSQALIVILMVISPVSFSTDKIPNFAYECPVATDCSIKTSRAVAVQRPVAEILPQKRSVSTQPHGFPSPITPAIDLICLASPCRAPPA